MNAKMLKHAKAALNDAARQAALIRYEANCLSTKEPGIVDLVHRTAECIAGLTVAISALLDDVDQKREVQS